MVSLTNARYVVALGALTALVALCRVVSTRKPDANGPATACTCADSTARRGGAAVGAATAADVSADSPLERRRPQLTQPSAAEAGAAHAPPRSHAEAESPASTGADGDDGGDYIIPDVFHFIRFDQPTVTFVEMLSIMSVLRLNPRLVMLHCNQKPQGSFWDKVSADRRLVVVHRGLPDDIYGIKPKWMQRKSDLARIQVLRQYGGIYLDNDCIMLRSVDYLRKRHKCVAAKSKIERYLGSQFFMAAVSCRYLAGHKDLYKTRYNASQLYYNARELPTMEILEKHPDIARIVDEGNEMSLIRRLFIDNEPVEAFSRAYDVLHTFYNHRYLVADTTDYNKVDYRNCNTSFANIARWLMGN